MPTGDFGHPNDSFCKINKNFSRFLQKFLQHIPTACMVKAHVFHAMMGTHGLLSFGSIPSPN